MIFFFNDTTIKVLGSRIGQDRHCFQTLMPMGSPVTRTNRMLCGLHGIQYGG